MEMRALIVVADLQSDADVSGLKEAVLEELALNRLIVLACVSSEGEGLPRALTSRSQQWDVAELGLFMSDLRLGARSCRDVLKKLRTRDDSTAHYSLVSSLHLGGAEIGRDTLVALQELLSHDQCGVRSLDLSFTAFDGYSLVTTLRTNSSLTALDVRAVPRMRDLYQTIGDVLLTAGGSCRLANFRCDHLEIVEGQTSLSLRERPFEGGELRLLVGLLKHNASLVELDLSATDIECDSTNPKAAGTYEMQTLATLLQGHASLAEVKMQFNPAMDEPTRATLLKAAAAREPTPITLEI